MVVMDSRLQPRSLSSLDYVKLWDEGCVKTRLKELTQRFIAKLQHEDMLKMAEKAKRAFKPVPTFKLPKDKNIEEVYGEEARKKAEKVLELERRAFVKSREEWLLNRLTVIRDRYRMLMFALDEEGKFVKGTFVNRVFHGTVSYTQNYVSFFGTDQDAERMRSINQLNHALNEVSYMMPYVSSEIKALRKEIGEIATPDHYENWHNKQLIQVYGGRYTKEDEGLTTEAWRKAVKKRAEKIMAKREKVAEKQQKKEETEKTEG